MGYFTNEVDTLALPSNPEFTVTVKRRIKGGAYADALSRSLRADGDIQVMIRALMAGAVVSWTLTDGDDQPVPVSEEAIGDLERLDYDFLKEEVSKRAALRPEAEEAPFVNGSGNSPKATRSKPRR